jgi:hypothetical protein
MKTVKINIKNLIGTLIVVGDKESASAQIKESVSDALLKAVGTVRESVSDYTEAPKHTASFDIKEIWAHNQEDFDAQIRQVQDNTPQEREIVVLKNFTAVCLIS